MYTALGKFPSKGKKKGTDLGKPLATQNGTELSQRGADADGRYPL